MKQRFTLQKLSLLIGLLVSTNLLYAGDFTCALTGTNSGNWNSAATWTLTSGTDADGIPDADDNVTILQGRVIVNVNSEVNNITVRANNNFRVTLTTGMILRVFGTLNTEAGANYTGEAPIQGETLGAGTLEFPATTTRTAISNFYGNTYAFGNMMPRVNFGTTTASSNVLTIGAFQSGAVVVRNCLVNSTDHYYIGNSENVIIESTATVYQDQVAGVTFGFANSNRNFNGINNFTINGTFRTGNNIAAANIIVNTGGTLVVSNAANATGLRANNYSINGTLEYNTSNSYTAGAELTGITSRNLGSIKLTGGTVTLPDLLSAQIWTINTSLIVGNGKLNLFEHTFLFANTATTLRTGTGYIIAQDNGTNFPKLTANITSTRTFFEFHIGTTNDYTPVMVSAFPTNPVTISASMYAGYAACGTGNLDLTKSVNATYKVSASNATEVLTVDFNYAVASANTLRGASYNRTNAKILGCTGTAYGVILSAVNIGEYPGTTLNGTYYGRAWFGGTNTPLDGRRIMISSDNAIIGNPPNLSSVSTTAVAATTATVNYTVNANGNNATTLVRYGTASNNLNLSVTGSSASGSTNTPLSINLTGLATSTQYFYSVEATNSAGNATPITGNFTTTAPVSLPSISNVNHSNVIASGATFTYTINPNGGATQSIVYIGTTSTNFNFTSSNIATTNANGTVTQTVNGLLRNSTYFYRIEAANAAGSVQSSVGTFTTTNGPSITSVQFSQGTTLFNANPTVNPNGSATTLLVRWGLSENNLNNIVNGPTVNGSVNVFPSIRVTGLTPNTPYWFLVEGTNANGTAQSITYSATTPSTSVVPVITNVQVSNLTSNSATIAYSVNINPQSGFGGSSAVNYGTSKNNLILGSNIVNVNTTATPIHVLTGLLNNTKYYYEVAAQNTAGFTYSTIDSFTIGVLPLTLTNFTAKLNNQNTVLNWQTSQEINTSHFEVEYSNNANDFSTVGTVYASGNSSSNKSYWASHKINKEINHYYRLKMVDIDGKFTYSNVVKLVNNNKGNSLQVYPTVTKGLVSININVTEKQTANIKVINAIGQVLLTQPMQLKAGEQTLSLELNLLPAGAYKLLLQTNSGTQASSIIKQ